MKDSSLDESVYHADGRIAQSGNARYPGSKWPAVISARINPGALLALVLGILAGQNLLLWRFLDFAPSIAYPAASAIFLILAIFITRAARVGQWRGPTVGTLLLLAMASLLIFLLGGEGRFFYSNVDWQIRDAVLHDLIVNPWPFLYRQNGMLQLLRAPIGMFLIPAIVGKAYGTAMADLAMLLQNSLLLTLLLGLGSTLFESARERFVAFVVVVSFSGMDVIGQLLRSSATGEAIPDHLERWAGMQYSSHLTQAFWVPQHAMAGWFGALLFLLWRDRRISLGEMYLLLPMLLLLSPLGVMGVLPFAAYAGIASLLQRSLRPGDFILPAVTTCLCAPAVLYLGAAGDSVGFRSSSILPIAYLLFELLEVFVFIFCVAALSRKNAPDMRILLVVAACLIAIPLIQVGEGGDFTMRVSISALALLAFLVAQALARAAPFGAARGAPVAILFVAIAIGSVTGMFELFRAIRYRSSPPIHCSVTSAGLQLVDLAPSSNNVTYFAPVEAVPKFIRPDTAAIVRPEADPPCWNRAWKVSRST